ncbi:MAG: response regulator [Thermodesulfobacteriota bacterium]|jgi:DNA-binding NtrC family response regulator
MKILVVDDDAIVIRSCRRILEVEGFEVSTVPSADNALESMKTSDFDLLLIDVKMPKRDGMYLMREIKKNWPEIPIIIMSGYPTPETITEVLRLGATLFIPKPFRPDELMKSVRQVLKNVPPKKSFPTGAG